MFHFTLTEQQHHQNLDPFGLHLKSPREQKAAEPVSAALTGICQEALQSDLKPRPQLQPAAAALSNRIIAAERLQRPSCSEVVVCAGFLKWSPPELHLGSLLPLGSNCCTSIHDTDTHTHAAARVGWRGGSGATAEGERVIRCFSFYTCQVPAAGRGWPLTSPLCENALITLTKPFHMIKSRQKWLKIDIYTTWTQPLLLRDSLYFLTEQKPNQD